MKNSLKLISTVVVGALLFSCKKDNYAAPGDTLSGHITYQGESINVERNAVHFQLYQYGYGQVGQISGDETFAQDGSYSAALFNGTYKLTIPSGDGPFVWKQTSSGTPDSVTVDMNGNQTVDLEVTPYYLIHDAQISASAGTVTANFKIDKIITDANAKDIEKVVLYINKTQFVSGSSNIGATEMAGGDIANPSAVLLSVSVPSLVPDQSYVYARVGLKIVNVEDMIFSPLEKVDL